MAKGIEKRSEKGRTYLNLFVMKLGYQLFV